MSGQLLDNPLNIDLLEKLSQYLNDTPRMITSSLMEEANIHGVSHLRTYMLILANCLEITQEEKWMNQYLPEMVHLLHKEDYENDLYMQNIHLDVIQTKHWQLGYDYYDPYEAFVCNDFIVKDDRVIPQIGFFEEKYQFPVIYQDHREWMLIIPNEIETMKEPIQNAKGNICTYGLGLGYFAYHTSLKEEVTSITIIEKDQEVISLFKKYILPQFSNKNKIKIICYDALEYAKKKKYYDYVFADLWHDVSDGLPIYHILRQYERKDVKYDYWIYNTMKCYE